MIGNSHLHTESPSNTDNNLLPVVIQRYEKRSFSNVHVVRHINNLYVADLGQPFQNSVVAFAAVVIYHLGVSSLLAGETATVQLRTYLAKGSVRGHQLYGPTISPDGVVREMYDRLEKFQICVLLERQEVGCRSDGNSGKELVGSVFSLEE